MFKDYWPEVYKEDINDLIELNGYRMSRLECQINHYILEEKCKIKVAECDSRLIGFMIYNYVFESVLICRAVYFLPDYRKQTLLRAITFSVGNVKRVLSQTYSACPPKELVRETKRRIKIHSDKGLDVWENIIR